MYSLFLIASLALLRADLISLAVSLLAAILVQRFTLLIIAGAFPFPIPSQTNNSNMAAAMRRLSIARILQPFLFSRYITQASNARLLLGNTYNVYGPLQCYSTRSSATKIRKKLKLPKDFARGSKPKLSKKSDGTTTLQATKNPSVAKHQNIETESIVVEYLNRQNVDISMIRRRLDLSRLKIAEVKKRVKFLLFELNLEASELGKMLTQRPVILVLKEEVLNSRLDTLHKVGISYEAMSYVVKHTPGILTSRVEETLPAKVRLCTSHCPDFPGF